MAFRVGIIGFGMAARVFHAPLIRAVAGLELAAVASSRADAVGAALPGLHVYPDAAALIADASLDVVVLATPNATHAPLATAALEAGRHVVVDKPLALSLAEARPLAALARERDRLLLTFQNRRWDSDFQTVREVLAEGAVGEVVQFQSTIDRYRPEVRARWREDGSPGSGLWLDIGPHLIDQALVLLGRPDTVLADLAVLRPGGRVEDFAQVVLQYPGRRAVLQASMLAAAAAPRMVVHGTLGSLVKARSDPQEAQLAAGMVPGDPGFGEDTDPLVLIDAAGRRSERPARRGCQEQFYRHLAAALAGTGQAPNRLGEMLAVQAVLDASYRSARSGRAIVPEWWD
ncbi:oxidoreductase [Novosphingobium bradum]|uniref:Oxidoreductase n=1 Tax=Novosphingobium bradum TaxID=1737444 RepID=A0ABV7IRI2_9SPHN